MFYGTKKKKICEEDTHPDARRDPVGLHAQAHT
jgi:hypothetical protein